MKFQAFHPINLKNIDLPYEALELEINKILPDGNQPRKTFSDSALNDLAHSIKKYGVLQPIIVRKLESDKYQIIAGERRWRASVKAGLSKIPAIIRKYEKSERMSISLIENIQRENLNPIEEAQAIQLLLEDFKLTHNEVAENIGKSRTTVTNLLRLLNLKSEIKDLVKKGIIEMGHARAILSLTQEDQIKIANLIISKQLSVRETEKIVQKYNNDKNEKEIFVSPELDVKITQWKKEFSKILSTKIDVIFNNEGKGKIVIHFESFNKAESLMDNFNAQIK